jgi:hypothetical protein
MAEEPNYPNLTGKRVSTTFRGLLHFPHSLSGTPEVVYDGQGTATALTLGSNSLEVGGTLKATGDTTLTGNLTTTGAVKLSSTLNVTGSATLSNTLTVSGNVGIGTTSPTEKLQVEGTVKSYKSKIISGTSADHELRYGSSDLFSIIVKNGGSNNFYIKNDYNSADILAPLWIDRATGEVNIKRLSVSNITNVPDPTVVLPPGRPINRNSNTLPVGMIAAFPMLNAIDGWLLCDGTLYDGTAYYELFAFLNHTYGGTGNNFRVPDYTDMFLRGYNTNGTSSISTINSGEHELLNYFKPADTDTGTLTISNIYNYFQGGYTPSTISIQGSITQGVLEINGTVIADTGDNATITWNTNVTLNPSNNGSITYRIYDNSYGGGNVTINLNNIVYTLIVNDNIVRNPGPTIQEDEIKSHYHLLPSSDAVKAVGPYGWEDNQPSTLCEDFTNAVISTSRHRSSLVGGVETRPKNMAVAYYIKW